MRAFRYIGGTLTEDADCGPSFRVPVAPGSYVYLDAHVMLGADLEVLLYLPAGEKPTEAHAEDIARLVWPRGMGGAK